MLVKRAMLVYQAGIANVFSVDSFELTSTGGRKARRLYQGDFRTAEAFARGLGAAGAIVAPLQPLGERVARTARRGGPRKALARLLEAAARHVVSC